MNPSLYQINTGVYLRALSRRLQRTATLDDFPDEEIERLRGSGFDCVWLLGVWQTGAAGREISLNNPEWRKEYQALLPDFADADVSGSCFAIRNYQVKEDFGGDQALQRLRERFRAKGLRLFLDFVPNHTAPDHSWVTEHPERYIHGTEEDLNRAPQNYRRLGDAILAYGRDPYFAGWPDTIQLNYADPGTQEALIDELVRISTMCDGVRCDMAMLVLPDVFERTWGVRPDAFWPKAIPHVRAANPTFQFMAEVYWDLEWELQQQGFDYTYDKRLYDRLREQHAQPVRGHLQAGMDYQRKLARFLENHDEPRAAGTFPWPVHRAAAVVTYFIPGLRFFHQGQFEGFTKHIPVHLNRGPEEPVNGEIREFYEILLAALKHDAARNGEWQLLNCAPAWQGNASNEGFLAFLWKAEGASLVVIVNYAPTQGQCYTQLPLDGVHGQQVKLRDLMSEAVYDRSGDDLVTQGLYLDLPPWGYHVFEV